MAATDRPSARRGGVGGKKAGGIGKGLIAVFLPGIELAGVLFGLASTLTGIPIIGAVAAMGGLALALLGIYWCNYRWCAGLAYLGFCEAVKNFSHSSKSSILNIDRPNWFVSAAEVIQRTSPVR